MTRIGITGHSNLAEESREAVVHALGAALAPYRDETLVGISCLARGADQLFAEAVLRAGGRVEVVLPSADYRESKVKPHDRANFDGLLIRASTVRYMPHMHADRAAYEDANRAVLAEVERLFAVWDGCPSDGRGGTADAVVAARGQGLPVEVIWPEGARRA
ncbi:hypothetical protein [Nocardiopsis sp. MG754419]|uniref:hypothetical protein n=1 Tax=Nocardiopsis sp. MG754419 TaxID=2259865 RepID=UPI001BAD4C56|nr:hypothetical protein [Nocardiopsis sp. MG754419]MBR8742461.1 hypothetical protein [Nocardiopsis sp. MG754419]